jgi:hypothetical protein
MKYNINIDDADVDFFRKKAEENHLSLEDFLVKIILDRVKFYKDNNYPYNSDKYADDLDFEED